MRRPEPELASELTASGSNAKQAAIRRKGKPSASTSHATLKNTITSFPPANCHPGSRHVRTRICGRRNPLRRPKARRRTLHPPSVLQGTPHGREARGPGPPLALRRTAREIHEPVQTMSQAAPALLFGPVGIQFDDSFGQFGVNACDKESRQPLSRHPLFLFFRPTFPSQLGAACCLDHALRCLE